MNFSNELQRLMKDNNYTQTALAEKMRTSQATINRWLKGINQPDFETLFLLCKILDTTPNEILGWDDY